MNRRTGVDANDRVEDLAGAGVERPAFSLRSLRVVSAVLFGCVLGLVQGCGGGTSPAAAPTPGTPTVTVTPGLSSLAATQALPVTVAVSGSSGTAAGSVTLTSGGYASSATVLSSSSATISIPAGSLAVGSDTLTASYTPSGASSSTYNSASGSASVSVTAAVGTPTVSATSVTYPTSGAPFQAVVSGAGTVFVAVAGGVQVFLPGSGGLTASCVNPLPSALLSEGGAFSELSFLPGGANIAGGIGSPGAIFYNAAALQSCTATGSVVSQGTIASDQGTQAVAVTPDGKYAFVSNEYGVAVGATTEGNIGVVALQYDGSGNVTTASTLLGQISTGGQAIAGMMLSPDGTRLYVTSEIATGAVTASGGSNPVLARTGCVQQVGGASNINGLLTVINVAKAESAPGAGAILASVDAGCSPVRMAETADNSTVWVAIRGDNRVLAFSTAMLESSPNNALLGYADTGGTAPVGIALFHGQQLLAVANSNRFDTGTANAAILSVANPAAASVVQTVATGLFPREVSVGPDDATLYLTNYDSDTLEVISTTVH
jgi:DNA-binding beta-propeller fold protein YncE